MSDHTLDARRLLCPLPVIRAEQCIARLAPGDTLDILCTDPGARYDIPAWCRMHGHEIVATAQDENGELRVTVRVGAAS
jgi:tRNA 2-thiouridine synthesizing protein A